MHGDNKPLDDFWRDVQQEINALKSMTANHETEIGKLWGRIHSLSDLIEKMGEKKYY